MRSNQKANVKMLNEKNRNEAAKWLAHLLKIHTKDGWSGNRNNDLHFAALAAWCGRGFTRSELMRVMQRMLTGSEDSLERFEEHVLKYISDWELALKKSKKRWTFIVPFQMGFKDFKPRPMRFMDQTFEFWTAEQVVKRIGKKRIRTYMDQNLRKMVLEEPFQTFIVLRSRGDDQSQAWNRLNRAFEAFIGLLEYTGGVGGHTFFISAQVGKPITRFPAPRWIINATPGEQFLLFWLPVEGNYEEKRTEPLTAKNWGHVLHNGRVLRHSPSENSVLSVAADGLRLYTLALNGRMPHSRLLGFWQLAEVLTLSDGFGGKTDTICNRLVAFPIIWSVEPELLRFALTGIAEKRNKVVHRGERTVVEDSDVLIIRMATESVLMRLLGGGHRLKTVLTLEQFYRHHSKPDRDLRPLKKALDFIAWLRREKEKVR